jgi:hypothetical protein
MSYWQFAALWCVLIFGIAGVNAYRYVVRIAWAYWLGVLAFAAGGSLASFFHRGPAATAWGALGFAGWLIMAGGLFGIPPAKPVKRAR